jgi:sodium/potassium-transporting ATPase subunit alpha
LWFGYANYAPLDPRFVAKVLNEASSVYFVNLVVMQWFNLMALRTHGLSIFQQPPVFNKSTQNLYLFPAILFAIVTMFIFCYIPGLQRTANTTSVPVEHFFLPMAFGFAILILDEARKFAVRKGPQGLLAKVAW